MITVPEGTAPGSGPSLGRELCVPDPRPEASWLSLAGLQPYRLCLQSLFSLGSHGALQLFNSNIFLRLVTVSSVLGTASFLCVLA